MSNAKTRYRPFSKDTDPSGSAGHSPAKWRIAERLKTSFEPEIEMPVSRLLAVDFRTLVRIREELNRTVTDGNPKRDAFEILRNAENDR